MLEFLPSLTSQNGEQYMDGAKLIWTFCKRGRTWSASVQRSTNTHTEKAQNLGH